MSNIMSWPHFADQKVVVAARRKGKLGVAKQRAQKLRNRSDLDATSPIRHET